MASVSLEVAPTGQGVEDEGRFGQGAVARPRRRPPSALATAT